MPLLSRVMRDVCVDPYDAILVDRLSESPGGFSNLYTVTYLAHTLQINTLLYLTCAKIASLIKGQPLDQIRQILLEENTSNDTRHTVTSPADNNNNNCSNTNPNQPDNSNNTANNAANIINSNDTKNIITGNIAGGTTNENNKHHTGV